jgi:hypothetical protein
MDGTGLHFGSGLVGALAAEMGRMNAQAEQWPDIQQAEW